MPSFRRGLGCCERQRCDSALALAVWGGTQVAGWPKGHTAFAALTRPPPPPARSKSTRLEVHRLTAEGLQVRGDLAALLLSPPMHRLDAAGAMLRVAVPWPAPVCASHASPPPAQPTSRPHIDATHPRREPGCAAARFVPPTLPLCTAADPPPAQGVLDVPLYGRVAALQLFRPPGEPRDLLLVLTERCKFCVLGWDEEAGGWHRRDAQGASCCVPADAADADRAPRAPACCCVVHYTAVLHTRARRCRRTRPAGELVTRANGDASDRVGRAVELGQRGIVDPACRLIGLHLYDGLFKARRGRGYLLCAVPPAAGRRLQYLLL